MRFGEVIDACGRASGRKFTLPDGWPAWLPILLGEYLNDWQGVGRRHGEPDQGIWDVAELVAVYAAAGLRDDKVVDTLLTAQLAQQIRSGGMWFYGNLAEAFNGWKAYLAAHADEVRATLDKLNAADGVSAINTLNSLAYDYTPIIDVLVKLATSSSKTVRDSVRPILVREDLKAFALPHVQHWLAEGDASRRSEAAGLLWHLQPDGVADMLKKHLKGESAERVRQNIEKLLSAPDELAADATREVDLELPPLAIELGRVPFPEVARAYVRSIYAQMHANLEANYQSALDQWNGPNRPQWMKQKPDKPIPHDPKRLDRLFDYVECGGAELHTGLEHYSFNVPYNSSLVDDSFAPPAVHLIHVVRLAHAVGRLGVGNGDINWHLNNDLEKYRELCPTKFGLREVDAAVATLPEGKLGMATMLHLQRNNYGTGFCDWEADAVWPAFAEQLDQLRDAATGVKRAGQYDYWINHRRRTAFEVLAKFPQLPPGFLPLLWSLALSESKTERELAQAALKTIPGKAAKVVASLADGKQTIRAAAAEWLGDIGEAEAIDPLKKAFRAEKQEAVKGTIMAALEKLGADVSEFLDRKKLLKEATAGLAKKIPPGLSWFPLDRLPKLRWADTTKPVDPAIVKWWIVQGVQQKSASAGPILKRYLAMCKPEDTAALAKFVLTSWIGHDTKTVDPEEAAEKAKKDAVSQWRMYGTNQYWVAQYKTEDGLYQHLFRTYSGQMLGSATGEKGMLAVVAAAGGADCVKPCEQYLKKWFGQRLSQCKCLVEVLAGIKHPIALQVLLSVANRFRTRAVQDLAKEHVNAIAEREGWTLDELADRTIPDAGFVRAKDAEGRPTGDRAELVIDYGPRQFTIKLDDDLEPVITGPEGKVLKSLPAPGKSDDEEIAKESRKQFAEAKKLAKDVLKRQTERLYEALCTQRSWRFDDWRSYLADHPVVGRLCVRLAWAAFAPGDGGKFLGCFRPLEDGTLTDENDDAVTVPDDTVVKLAHAANTPKALGAAWAKHFADYDVTPPFVQFGREPYRLPDDMKKKTEITDFVGHRLTNYQMRGKATKLGYVRGEAQDGGWFHEYRKPFPSLEVEVEIEFTGSPLPEEDIPVALRTLAFYRVPANAEKASRWNRPKLELGEVPAVLLSECYNDIKQIAAEGTGFDPEWEKKSGY